MSEWMEGKATPSPTPSMTRASISGATPAAAAPGVRNVKSDQTAWWQAKMAEAYCKCAALEQKGWRLVSGQSTRGRTDTLVLGKPMHGMSADHCSCVGPSSPCTTTPQVMREMEAVGSRATPLASTSLPPSWSASLPPRIWVVA